MFEDIALAHREIYALYEIAQTMGTSLGVADTMALISSKLTNLVPFSSCALFLFDEADDTLRCRFATGDRGRRDRHDGRCAPARASPAGSRATGGRWSTRGRAPTSRRPASASPPRSSRRWSRRWCSTIASSARWRSITTSPTSTPTITAACSIASREQASAVIHNSIVFEQTQEDSLTDPLTGLPNTRFMFMHLTRELARAERMKAEVALLVMDLDNFKDINDTHGHHVGDRALREVARVLRAAIRPYDICVRYAGDEFIVVLSGCGADEAERKRLELQRAVEDVVFEARPGRRVPVRISVGAAIFPQDGDGYEALLATADSRMYRDKTRRKQPQAPRQRRRDRHRRPDHAVIVPRATGRSGHLGGRHPARRLRRAVAAGQLQVRGDRASSPRSSSVHDVRPRHAAHARCSGSRRRRSRFTLPAGQAVMAGLHGSPLRKPYSIASAPAETGAHGIIELLVQVDDSGGPDPHLELATPGTPLDVEGPFGTFALPPLGRRSAVLLGGRRHRHRAAAVDAGRGARTGTVPTRTRDLQRAHRSDEIAYRDELEALARGRPHRPDADRDARRGRLGGTGAGASTAELLAAALPGPRRVVPDLRPAGAGRRRAGESARRAAECRRLEVGVERYDVLGLGALASRYMPRTW